jgi:hypothetical protein
MHLAEPFTYSRVLRAILSISIGYWQALEQHAVLTAGEFSADTT